MGNIHLRIRTVLADHDSTQTTTTVNIKLCHEGGQYPVQRGKRLRGMKFPSPQLRHECPFHTDALHTWWSERECRVGMRGSVGGEECGERRGKCGGGRSAVRGGASVGGEECGVIGGGKWGREGREYRVRGGGVW